jgi:hypothetical protein
LAPTQHSRKPPTGRRAIPEPRRDRRDDELDVETTEDAEEPPGLSETLRSMPLLDDLFLAMQALNIELVDDHIEEFETQLLREYIETERTPTVTALFISALSQMWVFAVYELLRTWRQQIQELIAWGQTITSLEGPEREAALKRKRGEVERRAAETGDADRRWQLFARADDDAFVDDLRAALNRTELTFRRIEAARLTLAKHEIPKSKRAYAVAAGYGRIDMTTGSIQWSIELGRNETELISRRDLADELRALAEPNERILPVAVQAKVAAFERAGYGFNKVVAVLRDGTEFPGVRVLWATEVVGADGHLGIPFAVEDVVDARPDPSPDAEPDANVPF